MDGQRFDELTRQLARGVSRRRVLKGLAGGAAGALAALRGRAPVGAVRQASCGNVVCTGQPEVCNDGCVCCVFSNGNSRCMPDNQCQRLNGDVETPCTDNEKRCNGECIDVN
ncbi:MAG TPA: hypothetical protein VFL82_07090, partial [Thermomicrobiales bacterium]|nr:hypothetical protein [Thermomicrobiales bacterium]